MLDESKSIYDTIYDAEHAAANEPLARETIPPDAANQPINNDHFSYGNAPNDDAAKYEKEQQQKENNRGSFNSTLDSETPYSTIDLLKHIDDDQLIKRLTITLANATQLPRSTSFLVGLAIFSSVATRKYFVAREYGGYIPIGLYVGAEQPSGSSKTWLQDEYKQPFVAAHIEKIELQKQSIESLKAQISNCSSDDKEDLKALRESLKEAESNLIPLLFITNTTPAALEMSLHKTNGFFSLVSSEQTLIDSLLGLLDSNGKGQNNNNEITLNGFDGAASGTLRNCRNAYIGRSYGAVVLFAQSGSIEKVITQRFLGQRNWNHFLRVEIQIQQAINNR